MIAGRVRDSYLSRCRRAVDERGPVRLQALQMITVDMTEEAGQWRRSFGTLPEVVDCAD